MKYLLYLFLSACIFAGCSGPAIDTNSLQQIADDFNKKGPRMIDSETKIESISVKGGNTIVYKYTLINVATQNVDTAAFKRAMKPGIISIIKLSPQMKPLREQRINFEYYYQDKQNRFIYNFKILPEDYNP